MKVTITKDFESAEEAARFLQTGASATLAITAEEIAEVRAGRKISAIKSIRTRTGAGLKEAKELADKVDPYVQPQGEVVPTWTDSKGVTHRLSDLDTSYLRNIRLLAGRMEESAATPGHGGGLFDAINAELYRRGVYVSFRAA